MSLRTVSFLALVAACSAICGFEHTLEAEKCYRTYFAGFNVTMGNKLPEYWTGLHDPRMNWIMEDGLKAQPGVCGLANNLIKCLSKFRYCMDVETYLEMGAANISEAQDYKVDLAASEYQCGAGYDLMMSEFYCMDFCRERYEPNLEQCNTKFEEDVLLHGLCNWTSPRRRTKSVQRRRSDVHLLICWSCATSCCAARTTIKRRAAVMCQLPARTLRLRQWSLHSAGDHLTTAKRMKSRSEYVARQPTSI